MKGKLFFGVMFYDKDLLDKAINALVKEYGVVEKESFEYDFVKYTSYYEEEMGKKIIKKFLIFKKEIDEEGLVSVKKFITSIEEKYSDSGKRRINIDPGYVSSSKVVLASFKKKDFKKDLGEGVYAHEVLTLKDGKVKHYWHTFKDYREEEIKKFFLIN